MPSFGQNLRSIEAARANVRQLVEFNPNGLKHERLLGTKRVLMAKTKKQPTYNEVLSTLGNERFDVSPASEGANRAAGARRVSKYGVAAEVAEGTEKGAPVRLLAKPGHLRDIHRFSEELKEATGAQEMYNEALGTTSDTYMYDRVKGRE